MQEGQQSQKTAGTLSLCKLFFVAPSLLTRLAIACDGWQQGTITGSEHEINGWLFIVGRIEVGLSISIRDEVLQQVRSIQLEGTNENTIS